MFVFTSLTNVLAENVYPRLYFSKNDVSRFQQSSFVLAEELLTKTSFQITFMSRKEVFPFVPTEIRISTPPFEGYAGQYPYWTAMSGEILSNIQNLAFSYYLTGDTKFADKTKEQLLALCSWSSWNEYAGVPSLSNCHFIMASTFAYDILYAYLAEDERVRIRTAIAKLGCEPLYTRGLQKVYHNITAFQYVALGIGGLALVGEDPNAVKYIAMAKEYALWFLDQCMSSSNFEGLTYTDYVIQNLLHLAAALKNVVNDDTLFQHKYVSEILPVLPLYFLSPDGKSMSNFGDAARDNVYFGITMKIIYQYLNNNGYAGWYLKKTGLDKKDVYINASRGVPDKFYHSNRLVTTPEGNLSLARKFNNIGWVSMKSDWTDNGSWLVFISGDSRLDHSHFDTNSFILNVAGDWLLTDPGYRDSSKGWTTPEYPPQVYTIQSVGHNSVQVNSVGQKFKGRGKVTEFFDSPFYAYTQGDAAGAYSEDILTKYLRSIIHVRTGNYFLIVDQLQAQEPSKFECLFHKDKDAVLKTRGDGFSINKKVAGVDIKILEPKGVNLETTVFPGAERYGEYMVVSNKQNTEELVFVTLMVPYIIGSTEIVKVVLEKCVTTEEYAAFELKSGENKDYVLLNFKPAGEVVTQESIMCDGNNAYVQLDKNGNLTKCVMVNGKKLIFEKIVMVIFTVPRCSISLNNTPRGVEGGFSLPENTGVQVFLPNLKEFRVGNDKIDLIKMYDKRSGILTLSLPSGEHSFSGIYNE
ncbi:MAG: heparinase II/III family protein [Elusimicrobiota bacterium]